MGVTQEVVNTGLDGGGTLAKGAIGAGFLATAMASFSALTIIPEGYVGVKTSWGKALDKNGELLHDIRHTGRNWTAPFVHSIRQISVQDRANDLEDLFINDQEEEQLMIKSSVIWAVSPEDDNPYRALFKVEESDASGLAQAVTNICVTGLRTVTDGRPKSEIKKHKEISGNLIEECGEGLLNYGVILRDLNYKVATETLGEMIRQGGRVGLGGAAVASLNGSETSADNGSSSSEAVTRLQEVQVQ